MVLQALMHTQEAEGFLKLLNAGESSQLLPSFGRRSWEKFKSNLEWRTLAFRVSKLGFELLQQRLVSAFEV